jgi:hypothetical protein
VSKFQKIMLTLFLIVIGGLVYVEATKPPPLNWFPSYKKLDKVPLGNFIIYDQLKSHFKEKLVDVDLPPFVNLRENRPEGVYLFINNSLWFDDEELHLLLDWADQGNTIFLSANRYSRNLLDTLSLEIKTFLMRDRFSTEPQLNLVNKKLKSEKPYHISQNFNIPYFSTIDTLSHIVLGIAQPFESDLIMDMARPNYLKIPFGKGAVFMYNQPEIFSNYFLVNQENNRFTENVLSYINTGQTIHWDNYYKTGRRFDISPLKILFATKSLKWAYYFVLIGVVLFVIFEGKRKQRALPIVPKLSNKTYEYTQTIASIYYDKKDNKEIAKKIIAGFLEYIRIKLRVQTETFNQRFFEEVAARSNHTPEEVIAVFEDIKYVQNRTQLLNNELENFYNKIHNFKTKTDGKP